MLGITLGYDAWSPVEANYLEITNEVISSPLRRAHAQVKIRNPHLRSARSALRSVAVDAIA